MPTSRTSARHPDKRRREYVYKPFRHFQPPRPPAPAPRCVPPVLAPPFCATAFPRRDRLNKKCKTMGKLRAARNFPSFSV